MSSFTRRHYELVAKAIRDARPINPHTSASSTIANEVLDAAELNLAEMFTKDNPRFDYPRFSLACERQGN